ncbi:serine/threonine protein kinase [Winslowiella iniecta]|uniref:Nuclease PIN n=1 Tax=Winslowiella iniecta TaxID=1560201 RepID=A0A0L7SY93_9GAMM|nr:serine/threonine-protein kinase [Winslowiella iniecta]KOC88093.1 nuclease PIN [Winslowiella iniecta]KOC89675.1 nuclease PIN [Winslowiella iniecta]
MSQQDNTRVVPHALPVGYRFNEFEIQQVIGGGGFGIVYRAWDHQLKRNIAIKEFMPASLAVRNDEMKLVLRSDRFSKTFQAGLNSFIQEARLLAQFNHPNLLHVLRFWVQNDTAYMGTQYYSGTTLSLMQAEHPELIDENWIRSLLSPLFGAINIIHQAGYLHRDISLDNIQIQEDMTPVLLDFGSARKTISNLSDETETMLKPGFAPIEQYSDNNESEQGPWTDIYALGAVLHTLITGSPPPVSVVRSIEDSYQPLAERRPAGYSLPMLHAIDCALALKPEERPQSTEQMAALMAQPLEEVSRISQEKAAGSPLLPVTVAEPVQQDKPPSVLPRRLWVPTMIATAVLVGGILGSVIRGSSNSQPPLQASQTAGENSDAVKIPAVIAEEEAAPPEAEKEPEPPAPIAQVYIKLVAGDEVWLDGSQQALVPAANGFARLQLPAGEYQFSITNQGQKREQKINIDREGTWLLSPQL